MIETTPYVIMTADESKPSLSEQPSAQEIEYEYQQKILEQYGEDCVNDETTKSPKNKMKRKLQYSETQKRARWIPGNRYMPLLALQWMWHPFATLISKKRSFNIQRNVPGGEDKEGSFQKNGYLPWRKNSSVTPLTPTEGDLFIE